jgi:hypothetical protein
MNLAEHVLPAIVPRKKKSCFLKRKNHEVKQCTCRCDQSMTMPSSKQDGMALKVCLSGTDLVAHRNNVQQIDVPGKESLV